MNKTLGNEDAITCPMCGGKMKDLWDVDPRAYDIPMHCEHCDGLINVHYLEDGQWEVTCQ